jgi:hypothetical protein
VDGDKMNDRWERLLAKLEHPIGTYLNMGSCSFSNNTLIIDYNRVEKWYGEQISQNIDTIFRLTQDVYGFDISLEIVLQNNIKLIKKSNTAVEIKSSKHELGAKLNKYYDFYYDDVIFHELRMIEIGGNLGTYNLTRKYDKQCFYFDIYCFVNIIFSRFEIVPAKWLKEWSEYSENLNPYLLAFDDREKVNVIEIDISKAKKLSVSPLFSDFVKLEKSMGKYGSAHAPGRIDILHAQALINIGFQILKIVTSLMPEDIKASIFQFKHEMLSHSSKNGLSIGNNFYDRSIAKSLQIEDIF